MPCCGQRTAKAAPKEFLATATDNEEKTFLSQVEANKWLLTKGRGGTVRAIPVTKIEDAVSDAS